ncbi:glycosyltransferase family 4 protein [Candidatus Bipolaricaulota bacterium]|nr:glycosyltransferase family 4 protein [Candidatus Bipolaricaulota bacterium]
MGRTRKNEDRHGANYGKRLAYLCLQATREGQASYAHVHEIIKGLERRGWEVQLFEPVYAQGKFPGPVSRLLWFAWVQVKLLFSKRPDIVYVRHHFAALPTALWARLVGVPIVQEVNGPYEDLFIAWPITRKLASLFKWMMKAQVRWASAVIAVTPQLAEWVKRESGKTEVFVIPNGVNIELFRPDAPLYGGITLPEEFVVFFGALAPWQGIDTMLKAVEQPEWPSNVKLVILGDGVERKKVEKAAKNEGKVVYLGTVPYKAVPGIVARAIAGLSPQNLLGNRGATGLFPLKVLETLACGVPVILTDFPGVADMVKQSGCGIVIPPEDPRALAQAVRYLWEHPEERVRMGHIGRELVVRDHSWDNRAALTDVVLTKLLKEKES